MKKLFFSLRKTSLLFVLMLFSVLLFGCKPDAEPEVFPENVERLAADDPLIQDWFNPMYAQRYIISRNAIDAKGLDYNGEFMDEDGKYIFVDNHAGNNLCVLRLSETAGTFFIKYTRAGYLDSNTSEYLYTTDSSKAHDVGKWYAISYTAFDSVNHTIKISGAYKDGGKTSCDTLEEAVTEFTIANGYFTTYDDFQLYNGE